MFTGLVQAVGTPARREGARLVVDLPAGWPQPDDPWTLGESVSVNGCCLTVVESADGRLSFDLSDETLERTNLDRCRPGDEMNLERALRMGDRLGGHIVQGHVDGLAEIVAHERGAEGSVLRVRVAAGDERFLVDKGSIALDGISLTVVRPVGPEFEVWTIPHTLAMTNLRTAEPGRRINVEFDVLAKHVERMLAWRMGDGT